MLVVEFLLISDCKLGKFVAKPVNSSVSKYMVISLRKVYHFKLRTFTVQFTTEHFRSASGHDILLTVRCVSQEKNCASLYDVKTYVEPNEIEPSLVCMQSDLVMWCVVEYSLIIVPLTFSILCVCLL